MRPPRMRLVFELTRPSFRFRRPFLVSALVHAGLVAGLAFLNGRSDAVPAETSFGVELVGVPAAGGGPVIQAFEPPAAEAGPLPEGVSVLEQEPPKVAPPIEEKVPPEEEEEEEERDEPEDPEPPVKDEPQPARTAQASETGSTSPPTPEERPGTSPSAPGTGPEAGTSVIGGVLSGPGDLESGWYNSRVGAAIKGQWARPVLEGVGALQATVTFEILRDGKVRNLRVEESSGAPSLDRSALRAVSDAQPLPPFPGKWREPFRPARITFQWTPQ